MMLNFIASFFIWWNVYLNLYWPEQLSDRRIRYLSSMISGWFGMMSLMTQSVKTWLWLVSKMLDSLTGVSQSYALLISIEFSFHFDFLLYSSFIINFPRFFKQYFRLMKIPLLRYSQNNYQIWLFKLNVMCEELSYQTINISAANQAVFHYY